MPTQRNTESIWIMVSEDATATVQTRSIKHHPIHHPLVGRWHYQEATDIAIGLARSTGIRDIKLIDSHKKIPPREYRAAFLKIQQELRPA